MTPQVALLGAVDGQVLRATGWQVRGSLATSPFALYADPRDVPSYASLDELIADVSLDAVALDGADDQLARSLPALLAAGLHVLLPGAAPLEPEVLRAARAVTGPGPAVADDPHRPARSGAAVAEVAVALTERWEPWAVTAAAAAPLVGSAVLQATVRGWPRGPGAAAELVDLARAWCGEVVAVVAAPATLPAASLGEGLPVAWSLLHAGGATTLVSHEGAPPLARLSFATARLEAGPLGARWAGGAELALLPSPGGRRRPLEPSVPVPAAPPGAPAGLLACAAALHEAVTSGDLWSPTWPWPADLGDLQAVGRVLSALRSSARTEAPVTVA